MSHNSNLGEGQSATSGDASSAELDQRPIQVVAPAGYTREGYPLLWATPEELDKDAGETVMRIYGVCSPEDIDG